MTPSSGPERVRPERDRLRRVRLLDVPVAEHLRLREHEDAMLREFALISLNRDDPDAADLPQRLLTLVEGLRGRFVGLNESYDDELERAAQAQDDRVTLEVQLPATAGEALDRILLLFEEADEYCRQGRLLTLATPPEVASLRRWMVRQIVEQLGGGCASPYDGASFTPGSPG